MMKKELGYHDDKYRYPNEPSFAKVPSNTSIPKFVFVIDKTLSTKSDNIPW
ncbi:MAG: hypothetical protein LBO74_01360 [Candidatus Symbiothrix sp.]|nr:hypothetical protein [Candidatus Symbiothrix sp.]